MKKLSLKIILLFALALGSWLFNLVPANATVFYSHNFQTGKTNLAFWENHGYYPSSQEFVSAYTVWAYEFERQQLVTAGNIEDIPLLIEYPTVIDAGYPESSSVAIKNDCAILSGEEGMNRQEIGRCYYVQLISWKYTDAVAAILELQNLSKAREIAIQDFAPLKKNYQAEINKYLAIKNDFAPLWSPDSKYVTYVSWQNEETTLYVVQADSAQVIVSEKLPDYQAYQPIWSNDSKYLFYGTLAEVKIIDLTKKTIKNLNIDQVAEDPIYSTCLELTDFNWSKLIIIGFDQDYFGSFVRYTYNLETDQLNKIEDESNSFCSNWSELGPNISTVGVISPNGQYEAAIDNKNGLRQFRLNKYLANGQTANDNLLNNNSNQSADNNLNGVISENELAAQTNHSSSVDQVINNVQNNKVFFAICLGLSLILLLLLGLAIYFLIKISKK